ncbi:uncharacterized protein FIBRA_08512 [Fibroporia radiculosa]|uniref:Uncharacterized protein n=1 Tax=Fibroporia radiculosa TaxID=599839 RepID=J4I2V7_9APHY|nr:uncharacterized protein FIBRA_08512 [Fibroporia radiculosa]CCM06262.1 predicted protein [Fibroporia radiculosa]
MFSSAKKVAFAAFVAIAAQTVSAISISSQCQSALVSVVTSSESSCLNAEALAGLVVAGSNSSLISPLNSWLTGLCSQPECTNSTLASLVNSVSSGCSSDLQSLGITANASRLTQLVQEAYPTVRQVVCLADTSDGNTLCVTETLTNVQKYVGPITASNVQSIVSKALAGSLPDVPSNVTCTNCTRAALDIVNTNFPGLLSGGNSTISGQCGANFTSGAPPSSITQMANKAVASNTTSGAVFGASVPALGLAFSSLLVVFSAFAVLA